MAQQLEGGQTPLVTAHYLAVDQAGPDLKAVHCLDHKREADRPVVAAAGDQPDADGVPASHEPVAVVFDLVNPVRAGGGRSAGQGRQGSMKRVGMAAGL